MNVLIQLAAALFGTLGFALMFNTSKKRLLPVCIGGVVCWAVYLCVFWQVQLGFYASLAASVAVGVYGELLSRLLKTPTTVFFIPCSIPLIPGGSLYRTMLAAVRGDSSSFRSYGLETLLCALGIALGLTLVITTVRTVQNLSAAVGAGRDGSR